MYLFLLLCVIHITNWVITYFNLKSHTGEWYIFILTSWPKQGSTTPYEQTFSVMPSFKRWFALVKVSIESQNKMEALFLMPTLFCFDCFTDDLVFICNSCGTQTRSLYSVPQSHKSFSWSWIQSKAKQKRQQHLTNLERDCILHTNAFTFSRVYELCFRTIPLFQDKEFFQAVSDILLSPKYCCWVYRKND